MSSNMAKAEKKNILEQIVATKLKEVEALPDFEFYINEVDDLPDCKHFLDGLDLVKGPALIAEVKKASPSKGIMRSKFDHMQIAKDYEAAGANCLSVLTDKEYFQGDIEFLKEISEKVKIPCLRKDFIIDKRQIIEARLAGADAILLIAAILDDHNLKRFQDIAHDLGMGVLVEVHNEEEMERALSLSTKLIGINNRNLETFEVDKQVTFDLMNKFKTALESRLVISESGIYNNQDISDLYAAGAKAFLVGESLVIQEDIKEAVKKLMA